MFVCWYCLLYPGVFLCFCSDAVQPNDNAAKGDTVDVLNVDTNHRLSRTLERVAEKPLGSPLIIRHVASDVKKRELRQEPAASTGPGMDNTSNTGECNDANVKEDNKRMGTKSVTDAQTEVVGDVKGEAKVALLAAGCNSTGVGFDDFAVMLEHETSQGRTTNADRALRVAPFTHASHGASLMMSEVVGGGGGDSDDEAGDGNALQMAGTPATLSKSPLGSSSSAQLSGHRSVQHMLKQIQDAGERINERISSRDFGARRRLPAVPVDAVDSDLPTSSQSAKSDGSGEAQPEHRPIRSVLEELHRPAIRSPKSHVKNSGSPSAMSRLLPDPSAIKQTTGTDNQLIQSTPDDSKVSDFPPNNEIGIKCNRQLLADSSTKLDGHLRNPGLSIQDVEVPVEGKQPNKLPECLVTDVADAVCRQLPDTASLPSNNETGAKITKFPDPSAVECSDPVDNRVTLVKSFYDRALLAYAMDLIAAENCPENLNQLDGRHNTTTPVSKLLGRGIADGESPRNTIGDEIDRKSMINEHLQSPIIKPSDLDRVPVCEHCSVIPHCITMDSYAAKCTLAECFQTEPGARKVESLSQCAFSPEYPSLSTAAGNKLDVITEVELKDGPNVDSEYVCRHSVVKILTSPYQAHLTSSVAAELFLNDSQKCNEGCSVTFDRDQLAAVSVPNTSCLAANDAVALSYASPIDTYPSLCSMNNTVTSQHDVPFLSHNDKHVHNEVIKQNIRADTDGDRSSAAVTAETSDKFKSVSDWLRIEAGHDIELCHETSAPSALMAVGPVVTNEQNVKSSLRIVTSDSHVSTAVIGEEPFCLAGPKRVLHSQNSTAAVSSVSGVIKTGSQPLTAVSTAVNLAGSVPVRTDRLIGAHIPVIRSAAQTTTVSSAAEKHIAGNQRKPSNVAGKIGQNTLSRVTGLAPPIRLSNHSPQPPTEPASKPAAAAAQARFVTHTHTHTHTHTLVY